MKIERKREKVKRAKRSREEKASKLFQAITPHKQPLFSSLTA